MRNQTAFRYLYHFPRIFHEELATVPAHIQAPPAATWNFCLLLGPFFPPTTTKSHAILPAFPSLQGAEQFLSSQSTVLPYLHSSTMVSMLGILSELYFSCLFSAVLTVPFLMVPHINFSIYQHLPFQPRTELRSPCQLGILIFLGIWAPVDNELELIFDLFEMWIYYFPHFLFLVLLPCSWNVSEPICPKLKSSTFQERFVDVFPFSFPK